MPGGCRMAWPASCTTGTPLSAADIDRSSSTHPTTRTMWWCGANLTRRSARPHREPRDPGSTTPIPYIFTVALRDGRWHHERSYAPGHKPARHRRALESRGHRGDHGVDASLPLE
jgi:hypothetical protein